MRIATKKTCSSALIWGALVLCAPLACGGVESRRPQANEAGTSGSSGETSGGGGGAPSAGGSSGEGNAAPGSAGAGAASLGGTASGGGQGGVGGIVAPVDTRPPAPEWEPPIPLGEPGWEESTTPLCEPYLGNLAAFDVWADDRGVYALFAASCNPFVATSCATEGGGSLQFNDGTGWQRLFQTKSLADVRLTGFPNGPLVLSGEIDGQSGIYFFEDGKLSLSYRPETQSAPDVFVAGPDLAYALVENDVIEYRAGSWNPIESLPTRPTAIWASGETLVVVSNDQIYLKDGKGGKLEALPDVPVGTYTSIWAFSADDFWVGNDLGQLVHYDGKDWTVLESGASDLNDAAIRAMWGEDQVLYFASYASFGRVDENGVELIVSDSSELDAQSLWGRSTAEVFFTVKDMAFDSYACGGAFILWFDGSEFHQF